MQFVLEERVKHRLIGLAVIVSMCAIFVPALVKKTNSSFEDHVNVSIALPAKPAAVVVQVPDQKIVFESIKVAHVELPSMEDAPPVQVAKAQLLSAKPVVNQQGVIAKAVSAVQAVDKKSVPNVAKAAKPPEKAAIVALVAKTNVRKTKINQPIPTAKIAKAVVRGVYAVQLASFASQTNAQSLVAKLRSQGYQAKYSKHTTQQGDIFKVIVGKGHPREEAQNLQKKLASATQLHGIVINAGVS